jgi:hypothetical protein
MGEFTSLPILCVCFVGKKENDLYPEDQTGVNLTITIIGIPGLYKFLKGKITLSLYPIK